MLREFAASLLMLSLAGALALRSPQPAPASPTFYRDVLPILQQHCQVCHRRGEIAPFSLVTYQQTRVWARAMQAAVENRKMPPWFADPCCGHFSNDPSLAAEQIATIASWADAGAPQGDLREAPPVPHWAAGWNIAQPDLVLRMPVAVKIPPAGDVEY